MTTKLQDLTKDLTCQSAKINAEGDLELQYFLPAGVAYQTPEELIDFCIEQQAMIYATCTLRNYYNGSQTVTFTLRKTRSDRRRRPSW